MALFIHWHDGHSGGATSEPVPISEIKPSSDALSTAFGWEQGDAVSHFFVLIHFSDFRINCKNLFFIYFKIFKTIEINFIINFKILNFVILIFNFFRLVIIIVVITAIYWDKGAGDYPFIREEAPPTPKVQTP